MFCLLNYYDHVRFQEASPSITSGPSSCEQHEDLGPGHRKVKVSDLKLPSLKTYKKVFYIYY